ncbi:sel1 repeat family protein [Desulfobulbus sp. AH-315-M07]|nr:sel1 repeat family protein [Desulfobulbus sp. AH-315-M07]
MIPQSDRFDHAPRRLLVIAAALVTALLSCDAYLKGPTAYHFSHSESRLRTALDEACDGGRSDAQAKACFELGARYYRAHGVTKDYKRAVKLFSKACDGGNTAGCSQLGFMYGTGEGVTKDDKRAVKLYSKGVRRGKRSRLQQPRCHVSERSGSNEGLRARAEVVSQGVRRGKR